MVRTGVGKITQGKTEPYFDQRVRLDREGCEEFLLLYTGCPGRNVPDFGRVFLMLKYTDITQNTYVQI